MNFNRKIILENGEEFLGFSFGSKSEKICEVVFNTSMVGYQEILSDPSYTYQAVVMTYPLIGNYGMADDDYESINPTVSAMIVHEYNNEPSNFRSSRTLSDVMIQYDIAGVCGIDTRKLSRSIRQTGSQKALITDISVSRDYGIEILKNCIIPKNAVSVVSSKRIKTYSVENAKYHVVAIDCGMKLNILREFNKYGCSVTVVPYNTPFEEILKLKPNGVFISNGPGDPMDVSETIFTIKNLVGKIPLFGICLGHQIISLAFGAKTYKLKFGHRGGNHPVENIENGKIEITSQNHSYAVDKDSIKGTGLTITHLNLLDNTVEGVKSDKDKVISVQYHPESAPGPQDSKYLFSKFISLM